METEKELLRVLREIALRYGVSSGREGDCADALRPHICIRRCCRPGWPRDEVSAARTNAGTEPEYPRARSYPRQSSILAL